jgi:murein DD-endopeptidase MepM/ murein hydrolase activator NlpD
MAFARVNEDNVEGYLVLNAKIDKILKNGRLGAITLNDRVRKGLTGRSRQVVALATLAGVASIGLAAASLDNSSTPNLTSVTASADQQRAQAAEQNDRSTRETPESAQTPVAIPSVAATLVAPAQEAPAPAKAPDWVNPMARGEVSSCFGPRWGTMHAGIDLFTYENAPMVAGGTGTVVAAGWAYTG